MSQSHPHMPTTPSLICTSIDEGTEEPLTPLSLQGGSLNEGDFRYSPRVVTNYRISSGSSTTRQRESSSDAIMEEDYNNSSGRESFTYVPGTHSLTTSAPAGYPMSTIIDVNSKDNMNTMNRGYGDYDKNDKNFGFRTNERIVESEGEDDVAHEADDEDDDEFEDSDVEHLYHADSNYMSDSDNASEDALDSDKLEFMINRASIVRTGILPCCIFVGKVTWRDASWEIYFSQKQILRLHLSLHFYQILEHQERLRGVRLPWTIWREKRAVYRVNDVHEMNSYIQMLLENPQTRRAEPLLAFLEVSPSRKMLRYGPSLKEGYVHMRINGAFQLPLYSCFNKTVEAMYRHLYRTWMRIAYIGFVLLFLVPAVFFCLATIQGFFNPRSAIINRADPNASTSTKLGRIALSIVSLIGVVFTITFVYRYFNHRLGVVRRWVVLKPSCFAAYRRRGDVEPSEVFLFDKKFTSRKGSYRQGVSWMPSGLVVGSGAGFIEIDTGLYYTRLTALFSLAIVCYAVVTWSSVAYSYKNIDYNNSIGIAPLNQSLASLLNLSDDEFSNFNTNKEDLAGTELPYNDNTRYCGYEFYVPNDVSVHFRTQSNAILIPDVQFPSDNSFSTASGTNASDSTYWRSDEVTYKTAWYNTVVSGGSLVRVMHDRLRETAKLNNYASRASYIVTDVGMITLQGVYGTTVDNVTLSGSFCAINLDIAVVDTVTYINLVVIMLLAVIAASTLGLSINFAIAKLGLWHAHIRRDHWFRCVKLLQKVKVQKTEYRYKSFAPQRVNEQGLLPGVTDLANAAAAAVAAARERQDSESPKTSSSGTIGERIVATVDRPSALKWYVDGEDTYEAMFQAISTAKFEILIAGWWVSPDIFLKRPGRKLEKGDEAHNETQLKNILLKRAEEGIKIYVLIYREVKLALSLNSHYTKKALSLHPNIRVLRDPIFQIQSLGFWSHHEKIVCIDQSLAFIGGLDLCFGRYDHKGHPLSDNGGTTDVMKQQWPGKDYSNPVIKDFVEVNKPFEDLIDRDCHPRMPWHDVHSSISGPAVQDIAFHFVQRWNFICSKNDYQLRTGWCICFRQRRFRYLPKCILPMDFNGWVLRYPSQSPRSLSTSDAVDSDKNDPGDIHSHNNSQVPTSTTTHNGDETPAEHDAPFQMFAFAHGRRKISRFMKRGRQHRRRHGSHKRLHRRLNSSERRATSRRKTECADNFDDTDSAMEHESNARSGKRGDRVKRDKSMDRDVPFKSIVRRNSLLPRVLHGQAKTCSIQVVRSVSMWSAGVPTETSIQTAYITNILQAKHFIYIENQFFISGLMSNTTVSNRILQALVDRIKRAVENKEVFRVYVIMPLLPAFECNIRSNEITDLHAVMHYEFATICRGKSSLFGALKDVTDTPEDHVAFFGLRNYGIMPNGQVATEQIYIHSKIMVVDDRVAIIGSANINDRSMLGERDSEIALVVEDTTFLPDGVMNNVKSPICQGVLCSELRKKLFREHLGLHDNDKTINDPASDATWNYIQKVANRNTEIFESVFDCAPSNRMQTFSSFQNVEVLQMYENQRLNVLKGRVVLNHGHHTGVWDSKHLKEGEDYAPWTDVNGTPIQMDQINLDDYELDNFKDKRRKKLFSMDREGWCYARNFSTFQKLRTSSSDYRKREKLLYFMSDRLMAQVRRRRWIKKGSPLLDQQRWLAMQTSDGSNESDDNDSKRGEQSGDLTEHSRFYSFFNAARNRANDARLAVQRHRDASDSESNERRPGGRSDFDSESDDSSHHRFWSMWKKPQSMSDLVIRRTTTSAAELSTHDGDYERIRQKKNKRKLRNRGKKNSQGDTIQPDNINGEGESRLNNDESNPVAEEMRDKKVKDCTEKRSDEEDESKSYSTLQNKPNINIQEVDLENDRESTAPFILAESTRHSEGQRQVPLQRNSNGISEDSTPAQENAPPQLTTKDSKAARQERIRRSGGMKKWYSWMDKGPRRSQFAQEYFPDIDSSDEEEVARDNIPSHSTFRAQNGTSMSAMDVDHDVRDAGRSLDFSLMESGRLTSAKSSHTGNRSRESGIVGQSLDENFSDTGDYKLGHVQTAATALKHNEANARTQLSEIQGHIVSYPLEFLSEENLKPVIMPADIHI